MTWIKEATDRVMSSPSQDQVSVELARAYTRGRADAAQQMSEARKAIEEVERAVSVELRKLGSPNADVVAECLRGIGSSLRELEFGGSLRSAQELAARASERAIRVRRNSQNG